MSGSGWVAAIGYVIPTRPCKGQYKATRGIILLSRRLGNTGFIDCVSCFPFGPGRLDNDRTPTGEAPFKEAMMKHCSKCDAWKEFSEFNKNKAMPDGYQNICKICHRAYIKSWEERHKAERVEYFKQWHIDNIDERHARNNANSKRLYHTDPEHKAKKVRQKRESNARQSANNPAWVDKQREWGRRKSHLRRAQKAGAPGTPHTDAEWIALCEYFDGRCVGCGYKKTLTRDHVIPLSKGGSDSIDNIQPLCGNCNSQKHTKTIDYRK